MNILGLSCFYHDSAACLVSGNRVVAAAQEERFNRRKHCSDFPIEAVNYCIREAGIGFSDLDSVVFYEKPYLKFARVIIDHIRNYPFSLRQFVSAIPHWLQDRLALPIQLKRDICYEGQTLFLKHHLSHAAAAFLVSPFEEAAIITSDGVGEWASLTCGVGRGNTIEIMRELRYPNSVGLLYTAVTTYLGFHANGGEGKLMGLAAYGEPSYLDRFRKFVHVNQDGSFTLDHGFFGFTRGKHMFSRRFVDLFGPPRTPESEFEPRLYDIAASLQVLTEEILIRIARRLQEETGLRKLCLAGGVFLNCLTNHRILEETEFERIFVQPAAGDAGGALGAAVYVNNCLDGNAREYSMMDAYLGPEFTELQIRRALQNADLTFEQYDEPELLQQVSQALAGNQVVGWFQGRMEFGPRALGNRSILGNPCHAEMKDILNQRIKKREPFRPFAPIVLSEHATEFFELRDHSPFMVLAPRVREKKKNVIPAAVHVDGTARVQTISRATNPRLYDLIRVFADHTGVPVLINTSFNQRGEPIVCSPEDAIDCFRRSRMEMLVMDRFIARQAAVD